MPMIMIKLWQFHGHHPVELYKFHIAFSGPGASNTSKAAGTTWPWNESWSSRIFCAGNPDPKNDEKPWNWIHVDVERSWMSIVSDVLSLIEVNCRFSLEL